MRAKNRLGGVVRGLPAVVAARRATLQLRLLHGVERVVGAAVGERREGARDCADIYMATLVLHVVHRMRTLFSYAEVPVVRREPFFRLTAHLQCLAL